MITLDDKYIKNFVSGEEYDAALERVVAARDKVLNGGGEGSEFLGWRDLPENYDRDEYVRIKAAAEKIRDDSDILVVIGIGGSYLGARAVIELLGHSGLDPESRKTTEIIFAGNNLSSIELDKVLKRLDGKDWSINVISKSGTTLEPALAFRVLRAELAKRYGASANQRIYATTDAKKGTLHDLATENGWEKFVVPDNIGGRYSVLTAVGLLPIAAAGIDVDELMAGAGSFPRTDLGKVIVEALDYALYRNVLYEKGYGVEVLSCFEPSFAVMNEWWKQLFGESEGKDSKGILPDSMIFTTDLHSLGQYLQDGKRQVFETFVQFGKSPVEVVVPAAEDDGDGLNYLAGKNLSLVNQKAYEATAKAHHDGGVPVMTLNLSDISPKSIGEFIYFMEMACAISAYTLGVNPFNQPGVEEYKKNMFGLLGK
ncbi:MAG: glucose-6-phosphate isomerase [Candidatus Nomurabacteria bacterium]|nr:glucose-6-phosphate isomerase [Candidatus Nomurabacteria bacterium]